MLKPVCSYVCILTCAVPFRQLQAMGASELPLQLSVVLISIVFADSSIAAPSQHLQKSGSENRNPPVSAIKGYLMSFTQNHD